MSALPTLFNIFLERIMTDALEDHEGTFSIGGRIITNLRFADDLRPYEGLLTSEKIRKLKWYRHVTRSSGLAKTILQGNSSRRETKRQTADNIKEWTCLQ